jgi:hypothetical protein
MGPEDILQFFSQNMIQGSTFCSIILLEIGNLGLEVYIIGYEVIIAIT